MGPDRQPVTALEAELVALLLTEYKSRMSQSAYLIQMGQAMEKSARVLARRLRDLGIDPET